MPVLRRPLVSAATTAAVLGVLVGGWELYRWIWISAGITLNRMVELLATNPAKLFGLYPRKGTIAVGSDADIVVFDPEKTHTISAATHHSKTDYNLFERTEVTGAVELVLLRGQVLV